MSQVLDLLETADENDFRGVVSITNLESQRKAFVKIWNPLTNEVVVDHREIDFFHTFNCPIDMVQRKAKVLNQSPQAKIVVNFIRCPT